MYFAPGTHFSNSEMPDIATERLNSFGDTIFMQHGQDGIPTGRESVVIGGRLVGLSVAAQVHEQNIRAAAPGLLLALQDAVRGAREVMSPEEQALFDEGKFGPQWATAAKLAISQALR